MAERQANLPNCPTLPTSSPILNIAVPIIT
jgi:hypothetical protein